MLIFPISKCPSCGCTKFYRKQSYKTTVIDVYNSDGSLDDTSDPSENGFYNPYKTWYCNNCDKRLFTVNEVIDD